MIKKRNSRWNRAGTALTALAMFTTVLALSAGAKLEAARLSAISLAAGYDAENTDGWAIEASNKYTATYGHPGRGYSFIDEGALVEPHMHTRLRAIVSLAAGAESVASYEWEVVQETNVASGRQRESQFTSVAMGDEDCGAAVDVTFRNLGSYKASVTARDASGAVVAVASRTFVSRYVRRSIRRLLTEDRDAYFDTFKTMLGLSSADGQRIWGPEYRSVDYFNELHLNRAAGRRNDALHDGMGFLTQHAAITNEFEAAMQAVEPSLTVPYWDYTYDGEIARANGGRDAEALWEMEVWGPDFFGKSGGPFHTVTEGRFAYQTISRAFNSSSVHNSYGYLRSPWNVNKSPFLTRVHKFCEISYPLSYWPSCATHYNLTFAPDYDTFYSYIWAASYAPHGPVHFMIGGYANCGDLRARLVDTGVMPESAADKMMLNMINVPKNLWRGHYLEAPEYCSEDTPQEACHLICTNNTRSKEFAREVFSDGGTFGMWVLDLPEDHYLQLLDVICNTPFSPGEQMESASPADASFWPIHPAMDRLMQYRRIVQPFSNVTWYDATNEAGTEYCEYKKYGCDGHHGYDLTAGLTRYEDVATGEWATGYLTNGELFHMANPAEYRLHYIYDDFTWSHCEGGSWEFPSDSVHWGRQPSRARR